MYNNKKLKSSVFSMVLAAGMLLPASGFAQEGGGLFCRGNVNESDGWFRSIFNLEEDPEGITNDEFTDVPMGSGLVILIGAGLGYAALKKKEDEQ
jgi:hypothetical protein